MPALTLASTIRLGLALLLLACGFADLGAVDAEAAWLAPLSVSGSPQARDPQVALDGEGNATVAWVSGTSSKDIYVAEHPAGGEWTTPTPRISDPITANSCETPALAVASTGAAVVVADCGSATATMRITTRSVFGTWSVSSEIPGSGEGSEPRVGIDAGGNVVVVWRGAASTVKANYLPSGSAWSGVKTLSKGGVASEPNVAMSAGGYAFAAWREKETCGSEPVKVWTSTKHGSAEWVSSELTVNTGACSTTPKAEEGEPQLAISGGGQRIATWLMPGTHVFTQERTSSGDAFGWISPAVSLGEATAHVEVPSVGIDDSGHSVAAWRSFETSGGHTRIKAATTSVINGSWSSPVTVGEEAFTNGVGSVPGVAVDAGGNATVVWGETGGASITWAVTHAAGGGFAAPTEISSTVLPYFEGARPAMDGNGNALVVYSTNTSPTHVAVAVDDVTPPTVSASAPATATTGTAVAMTASASDTWSPVSLAWDFGDGATATGASVSHDYATAGAKTVTVTATDAAGNSATATASIQVSEPSGGGVGGGNGGGAGGGGGKSATLTVKLPKQAWKRIAKAKAIKLKCKLEVAGICRVKATVAAGLAKGLGLAKAKARAPVKVGAGSAAVKASRFAVVKVKLTAKALARIGAATRKVPVKLAVTGSASGRQPATATKTLPIRRP